jgi:polysaccharide export outer membrane protein
MIYPGDTIVVPRAGIVYILGDVGLPHGVVMQENGEISLMQALSQAGSPLPNAGLKKVKIFRKADGQYQPLTVNLGMMTKGKIPDIQLKAEDVIWVPYSFGKNLMINGASIASAIGGATASGIIYTHP